MRVIAGIYKGRTLHAPKGNRTRPTGDRVREALFSIIGPRLPDAAFLDLYAGSGAIGIEALSRGASRVVFVDNDRLALAALRENLQRIGAEADVVAADAMGCAPRLAGLGAVFDVIFMDPPYADIELAAQAAEKILQAGRLADDGLLVIEIGAGKSHEWRLPGLYLFDERRYGDTCLLFYEKPENDGNMA